MRGINKNKVYIFEFGDLDKKLTKSDETTYEKNIAATNVCKNRRKNQLKGIIVLAVLMLFVVAYVVSHFSILSNSGTPIKISTEEEEMNYRETTTLEKVKVCSKEEGDAIFFEKSVTDAFGNIMTNVVHPGSTGTIKSTGGDGAHAAQGFNRVYNNDGYANFSGTLFISETYASYTQHILTLKFEIYGDENLLYQAPQWQTGHAYKMIPFNVDISSYKNVRIHFEAVNDSNLFSWEDCVFGISEPTFSKLTIGEMKSS